MYKYLCYTFVLVFLIFSEMHAGENYFTGGVNVSRFYDVGSKPLSGFALGYGHEWQKGDASALTLGISWFCRGARLENKIIYPWHGEFFFLVDINCRMEYLEIPFYYRYYFTNDNRFRSCYWTTGLVASLAFYDASNQEVNYEWFEPKISSEEADYFLNEEPALSPPLSSTIDFMFGSGIKWRKFGLEGQLRSNILGGVDTSASIRINHVRFFTFQINGFWYF